MKSAVENLSPTRVKLSVEVPFEEFKPLIDAAYANIGSQIQVPGFRKGKVPAPIIDQRVGRGAVIEEAVNQALPTQYEAAATEHDVKPLGQPEVDVTEVPIEKDGPLKFTIEVDIRPEITLPEASEIELSVPVAEVDEDAFDKAMEELQERFATTTTVERPAAKGDTVSISLKAEIDGEVIDEVTGVSYEVGSESMLEGMDDALIGLSVSEETTFTAPLAGGDHAGKEAECTVGVESVKVRELPALDDEFASLASSFDTLAELEEDTRKSVEQQSKVDQGVAARDALIEYYLEKLEVPLPDALVESEVAEHLKDEEREGDEDHRAEVEADVRKSIATQLILDELVEVTEAEVEQQDILDYFILTAQQYGMDPQTYMQAINAQEQIPQIVGEVARRKALAAVMEEVTVLDANGEKVDLGESVTIGSGPDLEESDDSTAADAEESADDSEESAQ